MRMHELDRDPGAQKKKKRVGIGDGSGHGGTSCKGHKGQKARSGGKVSPGFEGGQMPLIRRLPKRGFKNRFRVEYIPVNLNRLELFKEGEEVNPQTLYEKGIINKKNTLVKILGEGELKTKLIIKANAFSKSALEKIETAGGKAEVI